MAYRLKLLETKRQTDTDKQHMQINRLLQTYADKPTHADKQTHANKQAHADKQTDTGRQAERDMHTPQTTLSRLAARTCT